MNTIKETYNQIDSWLKLQDLEKIEFLRCQPHMNRDEPTLRNLKGTLYFYFQFIEYSDKLEYLLGEKRVSLKEIGNYMINYLKNHFDEENLSEPGEDYDGYVDKKQFSEIKQFWNSLDEKKFMSIINGSVENDYEIDVHGGRYSFISRSKVIPLLFNYLFYTLLITEEEFENGIFNTDYINDDIRDLYPYKILTLPNLETINKLYELENRKNTERNLQDFNKKMKDIIENHTFKKEPMLTERLETLKNMINV